VGGYYCALHLYTLAAQEGRNVGEPTVFSVRSHCVGTTAVIYASDYLNRLTGERIERECKKQLDSGCRALVINFIDTELVNSIGVSILLGIIDIAEKNEAQLIFSDVNNQTAELFEMLGLTRHVMLARDEEEALSTLHEFSQVRLAGH
jgi:anti-anti-sigma factor